MNRKSLITRDKRPRPWFSVPVEPICVLCDREIFADHSVAAVMGRMAHNTCWLDWREPEGAATRKLVAVVNDDEPSRSTNARLLRDAGFRTVEAGTGRRALELMESMAPTLFLLNLRLPDLDGFEVCHRIKTKWPTTRVVPLTGSRVPDDARARAVQLGADGFLMPPLDNDLILRTVSQLLTDAA